MNWNNLLGEERLGLWKNIRESLAEKSLDQALSAVVDFFKLFPYATRAIDYYSPQDWPTPWEILYYGLFCTSSISLLMYYTLVLGGVQAELELLLVEDKNSVFMILLVDKNLVLNYEIGMISMYSSIKTDLRVIKTYTRDQIKKIS